MRCSGSSDGRPEDRTICASIDVMFTMALVAPSPRSAAALARCGAAALLTEKRARGVDSEDLLPFGEREVFEEASGGQCRHC